MLFIGVNIRHSQGVDKSIYMLSLYVFQELFRAYSFSYDIVSASIHSGQSCVIF